MTFDFQDVFYMLPAEVVQTIISFNRTPAAQAIKDDCEEKWLAKQWDLAWKTLEYTSSDSDSE
jgi:hypothetical protein